MRLVTIIACFPRRQTGLGCVMRKVIGSHLEGQIILAALDGESTAHVLPLTMLSRNENRPSIGSTVIVSSTSSSMSLDISGSTQNWRYKLERRSTVTGADTQRGRDLRWEGVSTPGLFYHVCTKLNRVICHTKEHELIDNQYCRAAKKSNCGDSRFHKAGKQAIPSPSIHTQTAKVRKPRPQHADY